MDSLLPLLGQCMHAIDGGGTFSSVVWSLFVAGLASGFMHCSFMCAPFVLMQVSRRLECVPAAKMTEMARLKGALLIPYHLGRMTTYAILGGFFAGLVGGFSSWWSDISGIVLGFAGAGLILSVFSFHIQVPSAIHIVTGRLLHYAAPLTKSPFGLRAYLLGAVLGLLPCGMIYAALMAASATANIPQGSFAMAAFAAGTAPGLIATALAGNLVLGRFKGMARFGASLGTVVSGFWLCLVSASLLLR